MAVSPLEKTLMPGKTEGRRRKGPQRIRWLDGITKHEFEQSLGNSEGQGSLACVVQGVATIMSMEAVSRVKEGWGWGKLQNYDTILFSVLWRLLGLESQLLTYYL